MSQHHPPQPTTFLVAKTEPMFHGVRGFLQETEQSDFMRDWEDATGLEKKEMVDIKGGVAPAGRLVSMFAKMCYRSLVPGKNENVKKTRSIADNIKSIIDSGHGSVLEHVSMSFVTVNCSRVFTHELVRHRTGTAFSQTSGRYCTPESAQMIVPPIAETTQITRYDDHEENDAGEDVPIARLFREHLEGTKELIENVRQQLEVDDMPMAERKYWTSFLRRIMPSGANNEIAWTANVRMLRHMIEMRTSRHAEWEIRVVFNDVARIMLEVWPWALYGKEAIAIDTEDGLFEYKNLRV